MFWWKELLVPIPTWFDFFRGFVYILLSISSGWRWTATIFGQTPPQDSWCICWFRIKSTDKLPPISDWWFGDITCPPEWFARIPYIHTNVLRFCQVLPSPCRIVLVQWNVDLPWKPWQAKCWGNRGNFQGIPNQKWCLPSSQWMWHDSCPLSHRLIRGLKACPRWSAKP